MWKSVKNHFSSHFLSENISLVLGMKVIVEGVRVIKSRLVSFGEAQVIGRTRFLELPNITKGRRSSVVEQLIRNQQAVGSTPTAGSISLGDL